MLVDRDGILGRHRYIDDGSAVGQSLPRPTRAATQQGKLGTVRGVSDPSDLLVRRIPFPDVGHGENGGARTEDQAEEKDK